MNNQRALCLIALSLLLAACGQDSQSTHTHDAGPDSLQTKPGVWPPVLAGIQNENALQVTALAGARESVIDAMRASVLNNPGVKQALGMEYREFEASLSDAKSDTAAVFLFYNYAANTTVEASFSNDGTVMVTQTAAAVFQPSEHAEEVPQAIELARNTLQDDGYNLSGLTGTAMLAFPPITQIENDTQTFYTDRVLYVTFGPGDGQLPEYSALVNLSTEAVSNAKLIN